MSFDQDKTQMNVADNNATQMVMQPQSNATQFAVNVTCPVCETPNPPSETYCIDCGFLLSAAPVTLGDMPKPQDVGKLVTTDGTREFMLKSGENAVGRENADIMLAHNTVSRKHAKITVADDGVLVEDLGSTNGSYVDGRKLSAGESVAIADATELMFGSVTLKYQAPLAPADEAGEAVVVETEVEDEPVTDIEPDIVKEEAMVEPEVEAEAEVIESAPVSVGKLISTDDSYRFDIMPGVNTIGRRDGVNAVVIPDPYISGRHADLLAENGVFSFTDVGSTNGSAVNGVKLEPNSPKEVREGDEITIGQKVFRIEVA